MKRLLLSGLLCAVLAAGVQAQNEKKWGAEVNLLWPFYPGNIYKGQATYQTWQRNQLAGEVFLGVHVRPYEFREDEGDFANYALTFGYRQYIWKGLHAEFYQAFGPGFNRRNVLDGRDYTSWDYEAGLLAGYRWELLSPARRANSKVSPYLLMQHGFYYLVAQSNPHPIRNFTGEKPVYVGTLNLGVRF